MLEQVALQPVIKNVDLSPESFSDCSNLSSTVFNELIQSFNLISFGLSDLISVLKCLYIKRKPHFWFLRGFCVGNFMYIFRKIKISRFKNVSMHLRNNLKNGPI